jgi:hypothetical protein
MTTFLTVLHIKYCAYDIGKPLSNLYNSSLQLDIYPERFKYSEVRHILVYKTDGKNQNDNLQANVIAKNLFKNLINQDF